MIIRDTIDKQFQTLEQFEYCISSIITLILKVLDIIENAVSIYDLQ